MSEDVDSHTIQWSMGGYYFVCCMLIFNVIVFTCILSVSKYRTKIYTNKFALLVLIQIILVSFVRAFFMDSFIFNFNDPCHSNHENCTRCTISGYIVFYLSSFGIIAMLLMILKTTEINFQPFPALAYSNTCIRALKISLLVLFALIFIVKEIVYPLRYQAYELAPDPSIHICIQSLDKETVSNYQKIVLFFTVPFFGSYIVFCTLFVRKAFQLYHYTADRISPYKFDEGLQRLKRIMRPTVRHIILVATIAVSLLLLQSVNRSVNPDGIPLSSVDSFVLGYCVICMFPFGLKYFNIFCGCFERCIINHWIDKAKQTNNIKLFSESISSRDLSANNEIEDLHTSEINMKDKLATIEEESTSAHYVSETRTTNSTASDAERLPSLPEFRSIEISMECERLHGIRPKDRFMDVIH